MYFDINLDLIPDDLVTEYSRTNYNRSWLFLKLINTEGKQTGSIHLFSCNPENIGGHGPNERITRGLDNDNKMIYMKREFMDANTRTMTIEETCYNDGVKSTFKSTKYGDYTLQATGEHSGYSLFVHKNPTIIVAGCRAFYDVDEALHHWSPENPRRKQYIKERGSLACDALREYFNNIHIQ